MKKVFSLLTMAAIILSVSLSGCGKEDTAEALNVDLNRTATIKGRILINKDEASTTPTWSAPDAVVLSATVPYRQLNSNAGGGNYVVPASNITYSSGEFTIVVPVGVSGSDVTVNVSQFTGSVRVSDFSVTPTGSKEISVIWNSNTATKQAKPGETVYVGPFQMSGNTNYTEVKKSGDKI